VPPHLQVLLLLLGYSVTASAWDTTPHRAMTRAAIDSLPAAYRNQLGPELPGIIETWCMLPDRYTELANFGFRRNSPGPKTVEEMQPYCTRPDGEPVHSATWDRDEDLASLVFLYMRILTALHDKHPAEAARYIGVLAHFIEDSLSPPHAVAQPPATHAALEREIPPLRTRQPRSAGTHIIPAAETILDRLYAAAEVNRKNMPAMLAALSAKDQPALVSLCLAPAQSAAGLLADSLFTLFQLSAR